MLATPDTGVAIVAPFRLVLMVMLLAWPLAPAAGEPPPAEAVELQVFVRAGCPHCADAKAFLRAFSREHPGVRIVYRPVDDDPLAREELVRLSAAAGVWPPGVPTFVCAGELLVGFESPERTGPAIAALIGRQAPRPAAVDSALFGTLSVSRLGLPLFTLALGLLDGFNPCAMWVLLFLLSLLVHLHDRRCMALIAGTFVLASGAVYYAFMAAWLNVFLLVGVATAVRWVLGGVALAIGAVNLADAARPGHGYVLAIPAWAKGGLYARMRRVMGGQTLLVSLLGVAGLAAAVNVVELLCTAGLPAVYTAVLSQQSLAAPAYYGYLGLYIVGYIADDTVMVATTVAALSSSKLTERGGRWLKLASAVVMLALGAALLLRPEWLF